MQVGAVVVIAATHEGDTLLLSFPGTPCIVRQGQTVSQLVRDAPQVPGVEQANRLLSLAVVVFGINDMLVSLCEKLRIEQRAVDCMAQTIQWCTIAVIRSTEHELAFRVSSAESVDG